MISRQPPETYQEISLHGNRYRRVRIPFFGLSSRRPRVQVPSLPPDKSRGYEPFVAPFRFPPFLFQPYLHPGPFFVPLRRSFGASPPLDSKLVVGQVSFPPGGRASWKRLELGLVFRWREWQKFPSGYAPQTHVKPPNMRLCLSRHM